MIVLMRRFTTISVVVLLAAHSVTAQSTLATTIDVIVEAPIKAGKVAGASLVVARGNQTIVERAYGFADLQLDVPTPPGAITRSAPSRNSSRRPRCCCWLRMESCRSMTS